MSTKIEVEMVVGRVVIPIFGDFGVSFVATVAGRYYTRRGSSWSLFYFGETFLIWDGETNMWGGDLFSLSPSRCY